ncbi:hypothetical protein MNBD_GAMMA17-314 [hydrothermal vent metagenome]|uniref:DUF3619 family protein n=1 Tax=hydrothermal vent metagenome TaxID=652676 RepID=A0A3B0Z075_9ZZZZ
MNEAEDRLLKISKATLDRATDELDDATLRDLRRVRREALFASQLATSGKPPAWLLPMGGLATTATVAVLTVSLWLTPLENDPAVQFPPLEDLALLGDAESLEFYENLDFYLWLDDEKEAG